MVIIPAVLGPENDCSGDCKLQTCLVVKEGDPHYTSATDSNNTRVQIHRWSLIPRRTGRISIGHN
jgi:hypothetical protein